MINRFLALGLIVASLTGCDTTSTTNNGTVVVTLAEDTLADFVDDKGLLSPESKEDFVTAEDTRLRQILLDNGADPDSATAQRVDLDLTDSQDIDAEDTRLRQILLDNGADPDSWQLVDFTANTGDPLVDRCSGKNGHYQQLGSYGGKDGSWHSWYKCGKLTKLQHCTGGGAAGCTTF